MATSPFRLTATGTKVSDCLDLAEVRRSLGLLLDPATWIQIQALPSGRHALFSAANVDGICKQIEQWVSTESVYLMLNPVEPDLVRQHGKGAKAAHVAFRRWFFVDIDAVKPEEHVESPSTDEEHQRTRLVAEDVMAFLGEREWPAPIMTDSGNGTALLYRIDLPNNAHSRVLLKKILQELKERFDGPDGSIDPTVYNANRLCKLPGVLARKKNPPTADRPYRMCRLIHVPETVEVTPSELVQATAGRESVESTPEKPSRFLVIATARGAEAYGKAALRRVCEQLAATRSHRNNTLNASAYSLGRLVGAGLLNESDVIAGLTRACQINGLDKDKGGPGGVQATIRSGLEAGKLEPKEVVFQPVAPGPSPVVKSKNGATGAGQTKPAVAPPWWTPLEPKIKEGQRVIVRASEITPRKVEWLWPGRIPLGKLTTFAGVGGLGKTFVLCDITARITRGLEWPDQPGVTTKPGRVLFISGEDDPDDTLVPRLVEVGADLEKVAFLTTEVLGRFTMADLPILDLALEQHGEDVRFVAIDPPTAYLGGTDDHKNAELRQLLTPLAAWAMERRLSIVFNTHVNKPQGKVEAMMRVMGSVAWVNAVRAAHMFARDPEEPERRLFVPMKSNLGKERKGLGYKIQALPNDMARVEWLGEVDTTADQAVSGEKGKPRRIVARDWLIERFREKLEWPSDELFRMGREHNISKNAIYEAKDALNLPRARRHVSENSSITYYWWVPPDWEFLSDDPKGSTGKPCSSDDVAPF